MTCNGSGILSEEGSYYAPEDSFSFDCPGCEACSTEAISDGRLMDLLRQIVGGDSDEIADRMSADQLGITVEELRDRRAYWERQRWEHRSSIEGRMDLHGPKKPHGLTDLAPGRWRNIDGEIMTYPSMSDQHLANAYCMVMREPDIHWLLRMEWSKAGWPDEAIRWDPRPAAVQRRTDHEHRLLRFHISRRKIWHLVVAGYKRDATRRTRRREANEALDALDALIEEVELAEQGLS